MAVSEWEDEVAAFDDVEGLLKEKPAGVWPEFDCLLAVEPTLGFAVGEKPDDETTTFGLMTLFELPNSVDGFDFNEEEAMAVASPSEPGPEKSASIPAMV